MNNAVTSTNTLPITRLSRNSISQYQESLLDKIISRLTRFSRTSIIGGYAVQQHKSFVDEYLLDPVMGLEIRRTLWQ